MSHPAVKIVASWLAGATYGINAVAPNVPRMGADILPASVAVYDELTNDWVGRNTLPRNTPTYPCVLVFLHHADYTTGIPQIQSSGARTIEGNVTIAVQLIMQDKTSEPEQPDALYLLRSIRGSLILLDDPNQQAGRELLDTRIWPSTQVTQAKNDAPVGDNLSSPGTILITYPTIETTPYV